MKSIVTFGELLLSLSSPGHSRLVQAEDFTARYTGAETNTAVLLSQFGVQAHVVSKVPTHEIGQACINTLRRFGVHTEHIVRGGDRLGLLFMEHGASQRPTKVIYDRDPSSFRQIRPDECDWDSIFAGKDWFHFSGIVPALGNDVLDTLTIGIASAKRHGLKISCDCNYRGKLWSRELAGQVLTPLIEQVDVLICGKDDPTRIFGTQPEQEITDQAGFERMADTARKRFNLESIAMTFRDPISASRNGYSAILCHGGNAFRSRRYEIQIVDRVGTGDAFAGGLLFGLVSGFEPQRTIDFAVATACLKHSIPGDFNLISREEVEQLLAGDASGHVQR
jgi:2-dehydro-3-deoxygluconokinase